MKTMIKPASNKTASKKLIYTFKRLALVSAISLAMTGPVLAEVSRHSNVVETAQSQLQHIESPLIQIAILLDTSNSMDGLINQTRAQLWQMVDEFSKAKKDGKDSRLEVAVYEYGNSGLSPQSGYIRQVSGLTSDLDRVSEALFSLKTNGGDEYCGYVIKSATEGLQWSNNAQDIKAIFIAGNEPFTQGPINYSDAIKSATNRGIKVDTIFAGDHKVGYQSGWNEGALLAGGNYMSINHNHQVAHVVAPQDQRIAELNQQLNTTYIPYGKDGEKAAKRQKEQDDNSSGVSLGMLAQRIKSKVSKVYKTSSWDLVDAVEEGEVEIQALAPEALPAPMVEMNETERKQYVEKKSKERKALKEEIAQLAEARDEYVAQKKRESAETESTMSDALSAAIRKQGEEKEFVFN